MMQGIVDGEDNQLFLDELMESQYYRDASLSTLLITIPSGIDAFVDIVLDSIEYFTNYARQNIVSSSVKHLSSKSSGLRLSPAERLGFVIGIASLSVFILVTPTVGYSYDSVALYYSLTNFSTILSICPIVFFLERCTKLWTPLRSFLVILFINIGSVFGSASYCFAIDSDEYYILSMAASASIACATFVLAIVCGLCGRDFLLYLNRSRKTAFDKESWTSYIHKMFSQSRGSSDFYKHYVPEIHTFALIAICVTNVAWYFIIDDVVNITSTFMCFQSGVAVIVFVVEIRIRQNEVLRGLVSAVHVLFRRVYYSILILEYLCDTTLLISVYLCTPPVLFHITFKYYGVLTYSAHTVFFILLGSFGLKAFIRAVHLPRDKNTPQHRYTTQQTATPFSYWTN